MPRVAMVIQRYLPHVGGAERQIQGLAPRLRRRGFEVLVLARRERGLPAYEVIEDTPVYRLPAPGPKPIAALTFTITAVQLLGRLHVDLIHAHELLSPTSIAGLGKLLYGRPVAAKVLRGGKFGDVYKIKHGRFARMRIWLLRRMADVFIAISSEIAAELAGLGIPSGRCPLIPNGVDTERFRPALPAEKERWRQTYELPQNAPVAVFTGRLVPEKGLEHLLAAWAAVRSAIPDAFLLIAGSGPDASRLSKMGAQGIRFVGRVDDVAPLLQCADVFALPSLTEGLSGALLEALATGLPVIATSVGGTPDVIQHLENGYLIPPEDVDALALGLRRLLTDADLRARLGENGRRRAASAFSLDLAADRLAGLYHALLSSPPLTDRSRSRIDL